MIEVHLAERAEDAAAHLAALLAAAPAEPMTPEWVAVPSVGMRRWLSLELARHLGASAPGAGDGVAGNVRYAFPGALRSRVLAAGTGRTGTPGTDDRAAVSAPGVDEDPWAVEHLAWVVLAVADAHADDPLLGALGGAGTRYGSARRIADLFDRYHLHRPEMVLAWAGGRDVDGAGRSLADHHRWQPHLWRHVRDRLARPSPPERLPELLERLRSGDLEVDLPPRVVLFGLTVVPGGPGFLELADALAARREVHLYLLEPSTVAARRVAETLPAAPPTGVRLRSEDRTAGIVTHPLLRSWGRLQRETTVLVEDARRRRLVTTPSRLPAPTPDDPAGGSDTDPAAHPTTLLQALRADLRADRAPTGDRRFDPTDASVQFHACHGPTRQVEVLRDALLHLLADDELDLREDDIVVMCPDLARFAPLVEAVFGPPAPGGPTTGPPAAPAPGPPDANPEPAAPALRYRIADRSIGSANPLLDATTALLDLLAGRFEAPEVLDFLALAPVRARFGFSDDDLARIADWVADGHVCWGFDPGHRERFGLPASIPTNTWSAAVDRLLVGTAVRADGPGLAVGDVAPLPVDPGDAALAGRLADLLCRLGTLVEAAAVERPVRDWVQLVRTATTELFATPLEEAWQLRALRRELAWVSSAATIDGEPSPVPISFADLRVLLRDRLRAAPGRPDFFRGGITVTSTTPLRWVPFRVVALLGMDQDALAPGRIDGDDLLAAAPQLGDRDPRGDLRQSLLEAVLAAGDHLIVVRDGHDVRTNQPVPAPVAVAELLETIVAMHQPDDRAELAERLEVHHPRQPHDDRCFVPGALVRHTPAPWSFDPAALADAHARRQRTPTAGVWLSEPLDPDPPGTVTLDELQRFLRRPVRAFFEQRLGVRLPRAGDAPTATLPTGLDGRHGWQVGDGLVRSLLTGHSTEAWVEVERRTGALPAGVLGDAGVAEVIATAERLVAEAEAAGLRRAPAVPVPVDLTLGDGTRLTGTVLDRLDAPVRGAARVGYARATPVHRLEAWLDLMALVATDPETPWRSLAVHRGERDQAIEVVHLAPAGDSVDARRRLALDALEVAVDLWRRARREPIPLFPVLSHAEATGGSTSRHWSDELRDDATRLVYGHLDHHQLLSLPARDGTDPDGPGGRVRRYAHHLWDTVVGTVIEGPGAGSARSDERRDPP